MNVLAAIRWQWPGAQCVVRGGMVERWDGPMARPSDAEIAQAIDDYAAQNIAARQERDLELARTVIRALAAAIHKRFKGGGVSGDAVSAAQWEASIRNEWDALT